MRSSTTSLINIKESRHVRRVASRIGFIICGIVEIREADEWDIPRERQLRFSANGRQFVAKSDHQVKPRGGIVFREVLPGRGSPRGPVLLSISSLEEAEESRRGGKPRPQSSKM
jgi:hypothetical protein